MEVARTVQGIYIEARKSWPNRWLTEKHLLRAEYLLCGDSEQPVVAVIDIDVADVFRQ